MNETSVNQQEQWWVIKVKVSIQKNLKYHKIWAKEPKRKWSTINEGRNYPKGVNKWCESIERYCYFMALIDPLTMKWGKIMEKWSEYYVDRFCEMWKSSLLSNLFHCFYVDSNVHMKPICYSFNDSSNLSRCSHRLVVHLILDQTNRCWKII